MSIKRTLITNTSYNLAGYFYLIIASLISIPILLTRLQAEGYGIYLLFASFVPLLASLDFGLSPAVIRSLALPDASFKDRARTWRTSLALFLWSGLVIYLLSFLVLYFIVGRLTAISVIPQGTKLVISFLISTTIFINHLNSHFLTLAQARQNFKVYNLRTLLVGSGNTLLSALLVSFYPSLIAVFILQLSLHMLTSMSLIFYAKNFFKAWAFRPKIYLDRAKKLIFFGLKFFVGNIASQLNNEFSKYAIGHYLTASAISVFSVPQAIVVKGAGGISQLTLALYPLSTSLMTKERIHKLKQLVVGLQLLILLGGIIQVLVVYNLGYPLLLWWLKNPDFVAQAYPILKILSWFFLLTTLTPIPSVVLSALNYPQIPSFFAILTTAITIVLIIWLTPLYGSSGPAYAAVFSAVITVPLFLTVFVIKFSRFYQNITSSR